MKISNMTRSKGNKIANQFIISDVVPKWIDEITGDTVIIEVGGDMFPSYNSNIAFRERTGKLYLDVNYWDYSRTTAKYRNQFTGLTTEETKQGIKEGKIKLVDLN